MGAKIINEKDELQMLSKTFKAMGYSDTSVAMMTRRLQETNLLHISEADYYAQYKK